MNNLSNIAKTFNKKIVDIDKLEDVIKDLFEQQSNNYSISSFVNLIMNYISLIDMLKQDKVKDVLLKDAELNKINTKLQEYINSFADITKPDINNKSEILKKLLDFRKNIECRVKVITGYNDCIEAYEMILNKYKYKYYQKKHNISKMNVDNFAGKLTQFVFSDEEPIIINEKIKLILSKLPVRITKQKFFDYMSKSLSVYYGAYSDDLNVFFDMIKETFYPQTINNYGNYFEHIVKQFDELSILEYDNLTENEIDVYLNKLNTNTDSLEIMLDLCNNLMEIINGLLTLIYNEDINIEKLIDLEPSMITVIKIINIVKNNKYNENLENMINKYLIALEGVREKWMQNINDYLYYIDITDEKYKKMLEKLELVDKFKNIMRMRLINSNSLYVDFDSIIDKNKEDFGMQVDTKILNNSINKLISFIDKYFINMSRDLRRVKINQIMSIIPPAFKKPQQFYEYVLDSLEMCKNEYEKLFAVQEIQELMVKYM